MIMKARFARYAWHDQFSSHNSDGERRMLYVFGKRRDSRAWGVCIDDMIAKMACPSRAYASGTFIYVIRRLLTVEREIRWNTWNLISDDWNNVE